MNQQGASSSFPIGKVLVGCGCLSILILGAIGVAVFGGGFLLYQKAEESGVTEVVKSLDESLVEAKKDGGKQLGQKALDKGKQEMDIDGDKLLAWPGVPLTKKDVDQHVAFMKQWEGSSFVKEARKNQATLQELSKKKKSDKGALDNLREINAAKNAVMNTARAFEELEKISPKYGGFHEVTRRYFQIMAIGGAASGVAAKQDTETLGSDATAKKMLAEHETWAKQYRTWAKVNQEYYRVMLSSQSDPELVEKLSKDPDFQQSSEDQKRLNKVQKDNPGALVLGKLPRQSVETWLAMPEKERRQLLDNYTSMPLLPFFALVAPQKYSAQQMATQILTMEYTRQLKEVSQQVEAANEKAAKK